MSEIETEKIIKEIKKIIEDSYSCNDAGTYEISLFDKNRIFCLLYDILG